MSKAKAFKACDALTPEDFERHPVWTFDVGLGERHPEADETWVRPAEFRRMPSTTDVLFLRADIRTSKGHVEPGALLLRFEKGEAEVQALALLRPAYLPLDLDGMSISARSRKALREAAPKLWKERPLEVDAILPAGSKTLRLSGRVK